MRSATQHRLSQHRNGPEPFNVMVVGRCGVGKSTLLQTLCDSFAELYLEMMTVDDEVVYPRGDDDRSTGGSISDSGSSAVDEEPDPFYLFEAIAGTTAFHRLHARTYSPSQQQPLSVELIDTPGIDGSDPERAASTIAQIVWEIERRFQDTLDEEVRPRRDSDSLRAAHIHAVVYLVPPPVYSSAATDSYPHRLEAAVEILSKTDLDALRALVPLCNVVVAVGKCDTIESSDRALLRDTTFFSAVHEPDLGLRGRLFDFSDTQGTQREPFEEVQAISRCVVSKLPFLLCGSKHVGEWQNLRFVEEMTRRKSGDSRESLADWRTVKTRHNRPHSTTVIARSAARAHPRRQNGSRSAADRSPSAEALSEVRIRRLHQSRTVSLVRDYPWGQLQLNNIKHCDFALLVDLLFESFRTSLVYRTNNYYYEAYRTRRITTDSKYSNINRDLSAYVTAQQRKAPPAVAHVVLPATHHGEANSCYRPRNRPDAGAGAQPSTAHRSPGGFVANPPMPPTRRAAAAPPAAADPAYSGAASDSPSSRFSSAPTTLSSRSTLPSNGIVALFPRTAKGLATTPATVAAPHRRPAHQRRAGWRLFKPAREPAAV
ncbi:Cell division control protein 11 [Coemansia spiralis]|nr:Cell division control protein 11 [Coemansia spiralis]